jgi:hypothetical protein
LFLAALIWRREEPAPRSLVVKEKRQNKAIYRLAVISAAGFALALTLPIGTASAGFFDMLFGGGRSARSAPPSNPLAPLLRSFADPSGPSGGVVEGERRESGPSVAYCVRLCDGHPFPVQHTGSSPAQACASFCPATKTKVFAGGSIDYAVASDGKRYADLPNAFTYRKQLVADCSCNGKSAGGLARMDVKSDPTLRPGDIVATNNGFVSYRGSNGKTAEFTPVQDRKLTGVLVRQAPPSTAALAANASAEAPPGNVEEPASKEGRRRAQR